MTDIKALYQKFHTHAAIQDLILVDYRNVWVTSETPYVTMPIATNAGYTYIIDVLKQCIGVKHAFITMTKKVISIDNFVFYLVILYDDNERGRRAEQIIRRHLTLASDQIQSMTGAYCVLQACKTDEFINHDSSSNSKWKNTHILNSWMKHYPATITDELPFIMTNIAIARKKINQEDATNPNRQQRHSTTGLFESIEKSNNSRREFDDYFLISTPGPKKPDIYQTMYLNIETAGPTDTVQLTYRSDDFDVKKSVSLHFHDYYKVLKKTTTLHFHRHSALDNDTLMFYFSVPTSHFNNKHRLIEQSRDLINKGNFIGEWWHDRDMSVDLLQVDPNNIGFAVTHLLETPRYLDIGIQLQGPAKERVKEYILANGSNVYLTPRMTQYNPGGPWVLLSWNMLIKPVKE